MEEWGTEVVNIVYGDFVKHQKTEQQSSVNYLYFCLLFISLFVALFSSAKNYFCV